MDVRLYCCVAGLVAVSLVAVGGGCGSSDSEPGTGGGAGAAAGGCKGAEDCATGNACDPKTRTCVAACDANNEFSCGKDALCLSQDKAKHGACYTMCELFTNQGCGAAETCRRSNDLYAFGMCMQAGPAALGAACEGSAVSTGCAVGSVCMKMDEASPATCTALCNPWGPDTCGVGKYCDPINLGICIPADNPYLQPVEIGAACDKKREGYPCGAGKGLCELVQSSGTVICHRACRTGREDCSAGQSCHPWNTSAPSSEADLPGSCY